jgi:sugar phosphate permease
MSAALVGIASTYYGFGGLMDWLTWPVAFMVTGTITAMLGLIWMVHGRSDPAQHPNVNEAELAKIRPATTTLTPASEPMSTDRSGWRDLLTNRSLILLTLSYAAVGYFEYLFYFWMQYYFEGVLRLGKDVSRQYSTILSLAMAAGMMLGGALADFLMRFHGLGKARAQVVVVGMLGGAVFLGLGIWAERTEWIVGWFALAMAAVGATEGPLWATAIDLGGRRGATAAGIFNTGGNAGGVVAPVITPMIAEIWGWQGAIAVGCGVCVIGVSLWGWIRVESPQPPAELE